MSELKKSLIEKLDVKPSSDFDSRFFEKLEKEKKRPRVFASWLTWAISGCATASVLFIAITSYRVPTNSFNHKEYVESALEIQSAMTEESFVDGTVDLTSSSYDEI
jgi:hypothetical protein